MLAEEEREPIRRATSLTHPQVAQRASTTHHTRHTVQPVMAAVPHPPSQLHRERPVPTCQLFPLRVAARCAQQALLPPKQRCTTHRSGVLLCQAGAQDRTARVTRRSDG